MGCLDRLPAIALGALLFGCQPSMRAPELRSLPSLPPGIGEELTAALTERYAAVEQAERPAGPLARLALLYEANLLAEPAIEVFRETARFPENAGLAHLHLAILQLELGATDEAYAQLSASLRQDPDLGAALDRLGELQLQRGELDAAAATFSRLTRAHSRSAHGWLGLAQARLAQRRSQEAFEAASRGRELAPDDPYAQYTWGRSAQAVGRLDDAASALDRGRGARRTYLIDEWSSELWSLAMTPASRLEHARQALREARWDRALQLAQGAMSSPAYDLNAANVAALALRQLGRPDDACRLLEGRSTLDYEGFSNLINCLAVQGQNTRALERSRQAVERFPNVAGSHLLLGKTLLAQQGAESSREAIRVLEEARRLAPSDAEVLRYLGFSQLNSGQPEAAGQTFATLTSIAPREPLGFLGLAEAAIARGELRDAVTALEAARSLAPRHPGVASVTAKLQAQGSD